MADTIMVISLLFLLPMYFAQVAHFLALAIEVILEPESRGL